MGNGLASVDEALTKPETVLREAVEDESEVVRERALRGLERAGGQ